MNLIRFINKIRDRKKFTLANYEEFLKVISKYKVLPLNEFRNYHNDNEVVIGLRFDCDSNFQATLNMMRVNERNNISGTIFVLHTADYFKEPTFLMELRKLQSKGFEIGLHQNAMIYYDPYTIFWYGVNRLRNAEINVFGTSAHGDKNHQNIKFWKLHKKSDFGIKYEAYELDHNAYYSDCTFINKHRWHPLDINWNEIKPGSRIQFLFHAEHWG